jgi:hypothetical protein
MHHDDVHRLRLDGKHLDAWLESATRRSSP